MAPMAECVSPTFVLSATGQDFILGCHSPASMDKTQHGFEKVEILFESLTQIVSPNTEIWVGQWQLWWKEMEAPTLTQLSPPSFILSKKQKGINLYVLHGLFRWIEQQCVQSS